ncbi:hypothetical protein ACFE04_019235 [Oxalis oulophora]
MNTFDNYIHTRGTNVPIIPRPPCYDGKGTPDYGGSKSKYVQISFVVLNGLLDGKLTMVAKEKIVADGAFSPAMVHFRKLNQNEYKVVVMVDVEPDYEVPIPTNEIKIIGQARDGFLAWPKDMVSFDPDVDEVLRRHYMHERSKVKVTVEENAITKRNENASRKNVVKFTDEENATTKSNKDENTWLHKLRLWANVKGQLDGTMVYFPKEICGSERLHEKTDRLGYMDQYGFVNPMAIADFKHCEPVQKKAIKLPDNLSNRYTHDKLYLVPYMHDFPFRHSWKTLDVDLDQPFNKHRSMCNSFWGLPRPEAIVLTERYDALI